MRWKDERIRRLTLAAALVLAAGCGASDRATVVLESGGGTTTVGVEVADSSGERRRGLSGRDSLAPGEGMLFLFPGPSTETFWMKDTAIPLSIAFYDAAGRILAIRDMPPCDRDPCPTYASPAPYAGALEVNRGAFGRWGVRVGDAVRTSGVPSPP